jgi:MFS family permease
MATTTLPKSPPETTLETRLGTEKADRGQVQTRESARRSWRFWCLFGSMCLVSFISSIDATIVTTALPTITREIGGATDYVWIANCFVIASTAPQPLFAQISNIFGRRNPMLLALGMFTLGSGIAGGAKTSSMLIGGRTVQGLGTGGIYMLLDVLICDLVPLRERSKYLGITMSSAAVATALGPIIGGSLAEVQWRYV